MIWLSYLPSMLASVRRLDIGSTRSVRKCLAGIGSTDGSVKVIPKEHRWARGLRCDPGSPSQAN